MNPQRLGQNAFIHAQDNALINSLLSKSSREQNSREMAKIVDKTRCCRRHHDLVIAVLALDEQNMLKRLVNENRHAGVSRMHTSRDLH